MKRETEKITVEDLLRLKRAERPPGEFWAKFDSEMRAKQLSAIVSRRPWWDGISRGFVAVRRLQVPVGAAAALALTYAGLHYAGGHTDVSRELAANATSVPVVPAVRAPEVAAPRALAPAREAVEVSVAESREAAAPVVASTSSHLVPAPASTPTAVASASPFADGISVTLADYRSAATDLPRTASFGSDRDFEPSVAPVVRQAPDPLAQMDPAEERRARLLAPALPTGQRMVTADWMKERASSNDRMYESMDDGHSSSDRALVGFRF
jgi:hypothetical protein